MTKPDPESLADIALGAAKDWAAGRMDSASFRQVFVNAFTQLVERHGEDDCAPAGEPEPSNKPEAEKPSQLTARNLLLRQALWAAADRLDWCAEGFHAPTKTKVRNWCDAYRELVRLMGGSPEDELIAAAADVFAKGD